MVTILLHRDRTTQVKYVNSAATASIQAVSLTSSMTLSKLFNFSVPGFPSVKCNFYTCSTRLL